MDGTAHPAPAPQRIVLRWCGGVVEESSVDRSPVRSAVLWSVWVVAALLMLDWASGAAYLIWVAGSGLVLAVVPGALPRRRTAGAERDLAVIGLIYGGVVALMWAAFGGFTQDHVAGLFLCFAAALLLGTVGPIVYTVWFSDRSLVDLGLRRTTGVRLPGTRCCSQGCSTP